MGSAQSLLRGPLARREGRLTLDGRHAERTLMRMNAIRKLFRTPIRTPIAQAWAAALAGALLALPLPAQAGSGRLPDGRWRVQVEGQGPHLFCYFNVVRVGEVRGGRPLLGPELTYRLTVTGDGRLHAAGRHQDDHGVARGRVRRNVAAGSFDVPTRQCRGVWQAERIGA